MSLLFRWMIKSGPVFRSLAQKSIIGHWEWNEKAYCSWRTVSSILKLFPFLTFRPFFCRYFVLVLLAFFWSMRFSFQVHAFWRRKICNDELLKQTKLEDFRTLVIRRRWRWIGHVLRKSNNNIDRIAMRWTPEGKRSRGPSKTTWRRTVEKWLSRSSITAGAPMKNWLKIGSVEKISLLPYVAHRHDGQ